MSAGRLIFGIDVGTTSVKAGLIDQTGHQIAAFSEPYPTHRAPGGVVEQDPRDWLRLVERAMTAVSDHADQIAAIGLCSQVNTHVFLGADHQPLMPAIVWQDTRARAVAQDLQARAPKDSPAPFDASHALSRMLWVQRHRPDLWEATAHVMLPKDVCLLHLTGTPTTDPLSNIGLVGADLTYLPEVLDLVPGAADRLAAIVPVTTIVGRVRAGLPLAGIPVVSGTMDAWAGLLGAGVAHEGASVYLSGTSEIMGISSQTVVPTPGAVVFPSSDGVRLHAAPTQSGGDAAKWLSEITDLPMETVSDLVAQTPRRDTTPLFLPQLEGERAPLWDPTLRGAFLGLSRRTSPGDLARAVFEGVALSARHALGVLQTSAATQSPTIACGGGGFRSAAWTQIRADILGVPLQPLATGEPGLLGAATLAAIGVGAFDYLHEAQAALARYHPEVLPDAEAHAIYSDLFVIYEDAIASNASLGRRLTALPSPMS